MRLRDFARNILGNLLIAACSVASAQVSVAEVRPDGLETLAVPPEKPFCFDCYEDNYAEYERLLAQFKKAQAVKPRKLRKIDDFYVSRVGVLIHEQCFDGRFDFDVEQAVVDAMVKGMTCQVGLVGKSERALGTKGEAYYSHIPRLVNLLTNSTRVDEGAVLEDIENRPVLMRNPCQSYRTLPIAKDMEVSEDCEYVASIELGRPKLICQVDQFALAVDLLKDEYQLHANDDGATAYSSGPHNRQAAFVNYESRTKVYNYPVIGFRKSNQIHPVEFRSSFWHELMHNLGYTHTGKLGSDAPPDYPYFCEIACFGDEYIQAATTDAQREGVEDSFDRNTIGAAGHYCVEKAKDSSHDSILGDYLRALQATFD
jgi:hypothetical protein